MRGKLFLLATILLISFTNGSGQNDIPVLDLEKALKSKFSMTKLSELASKLDYVKLETCSDCLINYISKLYPLDNGFLINDSYKRLLFFGTDGSFKWKIDRKGQGPGEYSSCISSFDKVKQEVLVLDGNSNLLVFDINGQYKRTDSLNIKIAKIHVLEDGKLLATNNGLSNGILLRLLNPERIVVREYADYYPVRPTGHDDVGRPIRIYPAYITPKPNGALIHKQDSVWLLDASNNLIPFMKTKNEIQGNHNGYYRYLVHYVDTDRLGFEISWKRTQGIYNIRDQKFYLFNGTEKSQLIDDIDGGTPFTLNSCCDGIIYNQINPVDILMSDYHIREGSKLNKLVAESTENDNPILRLVFLK